MTVCRLAGTGVNPPVAPQLEPADVSPSGCRYLWVPAAEPPWLFFRLHTGLHQTEDTVHRFLLPPLRYLHKHKHTRLFNLYKPPRGTRIQLQWINGFIFITLGLFFRGDQEVHSYWWGRGRRWASWVGISAVSWCLTRTADPSRGRWRGNSGGRGCCYGREDRDKTGLIQWKIPDQPASVMSFGTSRQPVQAFKFDTRVGDWQRESEQQNGITVWFRRVAEWSRL